MLKYTKDGRTIRTGADYTAFRFEVYLVQSSRCANRNCDIEGGRFTSLDHPLEFDDSFHLNHLQGRGGGKRDDVMVRNGKQIVRGDCGKCHRVFHGQQEAVRSQPQWSKKRVDESSNVC